MLQTSKFLHAYNNNDAKAIAIPRVLSETDELNNAIVNIALTMEHNQIRSPTKNNKK